MSLDVLIVLALCVGTLHCFEPTEVPGCNEPLTPQKSKICIECSGGNCQVSQQYTGDVEADSKPQTETDDVTTPVSDPTKIQPEVNVCKEASPRNSRICFDCSGKNCEMSWKTKDWECDTKDDCKPDQCCVHYFEGSKRIQKCAPLGKKWDLCDWRNFTHCACANDLEYTCLYPNRMTSEVYKRCRTETEYCTMYCDPTVFYTE